MWSKLISAGSKFLQKAAPKLLAAGEKILPKVTAAGEKVMGKLPGVVASAQEGVVKAWGKVGSKLASPATKASIEGVGKGVAKGFGKVGSWMASHPLGTAKLAATGFVGFEANKFLTNTTGKGLVENVGDAVQAVDNVAGGKPAQAGMATQTADQAGPAGIVGGIFNTVSGVFNTVSNVVGGLVGNKDMGGVLTALGVGAAGIFGLKRVGILAPLAIAGAGLFAANQAGLFKGAQQSGSPLASQTNADLSKIAFASNTGTGVGVNSSSPSTGVSGLQGNSISYMTRAQAEATLTDVERARLGAARDTISRVELLSKDISSADKKTPEQIASDAAKRELKAWKMAGLDSKIPFAYSIPLHNMAGELTGSSAKDPRSTIEKLGTGGLLAGNKDLRSKHPGFDNNDHNPGTVAGLDTTGAAIGKSSLDTSQMLSGAGLVSGAAAAAAGAAKSTSEPSVTVEADVDDVSPQKPDLGPEQLA